MKVVTGGTGNYCRCLRHHAVLTQQVPPTAPLLHLHGPVLGRKARDAGFDALLAKPADTDALVRLLTRPRR